MSSQLSLCAGMEVLARTRSGSKEARRRARRMPFYRGICPCTERVRVGAVRAMCAAHLDKTPLAGPHAFLQVAVEVFFGGQEETTMAMLRQNQFVAVFYSWYPVL